MLTGLTLVILFLCACLSKHHAIDIYSFYFKNRRSVAIGCRCCCIRCDSRRFMVRMLQHILESPERFIEADCLAHYQRFGLGRSWVKPHFAFLTNSQVRLVLLVGDHTFENQRSIRTPLFTKNIGKQCMVIAARKPLPGLPTAGLREIINRPACISQGPNWKQMAHFK